MMEKWERTKTRKQRKALPQFMSLIEMAEPKSINAQNVHFLQGVVELFTNTCQRYIRWQNFLVVTVNSRPGTKHPCTIIELGTVTN